MIVLGRKDGLRAGRLSQGFVALLADEKVVDRRCEMVIVRINA